MFPFVALCRDVELTERLDYSSATVLAGFSLILAIFRSFSIQDQSAKIMVTAPILAVAATHILYLNFYNLDEGMTTINDSSGIICFQDNVGVSFFQMKLLSLICRASPESSVRNRGSGACCVGVMGGFNFASVQVEAKSFLRLEHTHNVPSNA